MDLLNLIVKLARLFRDADEYNNDNRGDFIDFISKRFGLKGVEWCAIFAVTIVEWACEVLGLKCLIPHTASSQTLYIECYKLGATYQNPKNIRPGHLAVYKRGDEWKGHVLIITSEWLSGDKMKSIEGNVPDADFGTGAGKKKQGVNERVRSVAAGEFVKDDWYIVGFIDPSKLV